MSLTSSGYYGVSLGAPAFLDTVFSRHCGMNSTAWPWPVVQSRKQHPHSIGEAGPAAYKRATETRRQKEDESKAHPALVPSWRAIRLSRPSVRPERRRAAPPVCSASTFLLGVYVRASCI